MVISRRFKFCAYLRRLLFRAASILSNVTPFSRACRFNAGSTGWVGPSIDDIEAVLTAGGNIREVWALLYALTKTNYITTIMTTLLSSPSPGTQVAPNRKRVRGFKSKQHGLIQISRCSPSCNARFPRRISRYELCRDLAALAACPANTGAAISPLRSRLQVGPRRA